MHKKFMKEAIKEAIKAREKGEVPIGCVIVLDNKIIARGHNMREQKQSSLMHAEIIAIGKACKKLESWRLIGASIYITLEPCPMCAGAIINSRITSVYFGASDKRFGAVLSHSKLFDIEFNHKPAYYSGVLEQECSTMLTDFFKNLRNQRSESK